MKQITCTKSLETKIKQWTDKKTNTLGDVLNTLSMQRHAIRYIKTCLPFYTSDVCLNKQKHTINIEDIIIQLCQTLIQTGVLRVHVFLLQCLDLKDPL